MEIAVPDEFKHLYVQNEERPIVKVPAEVLRKKAEEVTKLGRETQGLISDMIRCMTQANGIGLAAPQLGVLKRVIIVATPDMKPIPLINPKIVSAEGSQIGQEGCLSIPGLYGDVERSAFVEVEAYDRNGRPALYEMEGLMARVLQHEVDHLEGILFLDKVDKETLHWMLPEQHPEQEVE